MDGGGTPKVASPDNVPGRSSGNEGVTGDASTCWVISFSPLLTGWDWIIVEAGPTASGASISRWVASRDTT